MKTIVTLCAIGVWASLDMDPSQAVPPRGQVAHIVHLAALAPLLFVLIGTMRRWLRFETTELILFSVVSVMLWTWIFSGGLNATAATVDNHLLDAVNIAVVLVAGGYHAFHGRRARVAALVTVVLFTVAVGITSVRSQFTEDDVYVVVALFVTTGLIDGLSGSNTLLRRLEEGARREAQLAYLDAMTGLINRRGGTEQLADVPRGAALVLVDIDNFKQVNDTHGHAVGDEVIVGVAAALEEVVRDEDAVIRWGGEEFLLVLAPSATLVADGVLDRVRTQVERAPIEPSVTVSVGASVIERDESWEDALQRADAALYEAKETGRNRVVLARPGGTAT